MDALADPLSRRRRPQVQLRLQPCRPALQVDDIDVLARSTAIDHEDNRYYVAEHYAEGIPDRLHAAAYKKLLKGFGLIGPNGQLLPTLGVYADPGGAGAQAIVNLGDYGST